MNKDDKTTNALGSLLGYNPYRDTEGRFDDGPNLQASRGRKKVSAVSQREKIEKAKEKLRAEYAVKDNTPEREKVLEGPQYLDTAGFAINEKTLSDNDVRTALWKDKELLPGQTYGEYYEKEKARKSDIFMMTPAEYRQALVESGQYKDIESIDKRMESDKIEKYTEDMMSGDKFPPPSLYYEEDGTTSQEGLHRIYAAEKVGIEEIPVVVSSDTRNQKIYPYQKLEDKILSQDEIHDRAQEEPEAEDESDNPAIEETFYALSSYGEEHTQLTAKQKDASLTASEKANISKELKELEKNIQVEKDKALDTINNGEHDNEFLLSLRSTVESEQAVALENGNTTYLGALDDIAIAATDKLEERDGIEDGAGEGAGDGEGGDNATSSEADDTPDNDAIYNSLDTYLTAGQDAYIAENEASDAEQEDDSVLLQKLEQEVDEARDKMAAALTDMTASVNETYDFTGKSERYISDSLNQIEILQGRLDAEIRIAKRENDSHLSDGLSQVASAVREKRMEVEDLLEEYHKAKDTAEEDITSEPALSFNTVEDFEKNKDILIKKDPDFYRADNLERLNDAIGFNGKPQTSDNMPEGATELNRVWSDQAFYDSYMNDDTPRLSVGIYGSGIYFSTSAEGARTAANTSGDKMVFSQAYIDPSAKGIDAAELNTQMYEEGQSVNEMFEKELADTKKIKDKIKRAEEQVRIQEAQRGAQALYKDAGLFGATKGYDYISTSDNGSTDGQNEFIVLNRSKVVFLNKDDSQDDSNGQSTEDRSGDGSTNVSESTSSPHLYNNQWPDYNMTAPEGYTILYTNTKSENIDAIMADGLKVGLNADGYRLSPEEGNQVWTDTGSPGSMAYGGNTVAFKVKNEEAEAGKVNDTQHAIPHDIAPEDIMFVDKVLKSDSGVKVSNLPEYIEKFGEEKAITVTAKTGDGFSEQELRDLISVYKSQSTVPATDNETETELPAVIDSNSFQSLTKFTQEESEAKLSAALVEHDIELKEDETVWDYARAIRRKLYKENPDPKRGEKEDIDDYLESDAYLEQEAKREARYQEVIADINSSMGVNTEQGELYISQDDYDILTGDSDKLPLTAVNFYKAGMFSLKDGRVKLEIIENLERTKPQYWFDKDEEDEYFESLISQNKFIKVDEAKVKKLLVERAEDSGKYRLTFPQISRQEVKALQEYNLVSAVNQSLRNGETPKSGDLIESAINKTYTRGKTLYRGLRGEYADEVKNLKVGERISDKGFMSTADRLGYNENEGARKFGEGGTLMQINLPSGFGHAIDMSPYLSSMSFMAEDEIVLNRNTELEFVGYVTQKVKDKDGTSKELTLMEFDIVVKTADTEEQSATDDSSTAGANDDSSSAAEAENVDRPESPIDESTVGTESIPEKRVNGVPVKLEGNEYYDELLADFGVPAQKYYDMSDEELAESVSNLLDELKVKTDNRLAEKGLTSEEAHKFFNNWGKWSDAKLDREFGREKIKLMKEMSANNGRGDDYLLLDNLSKLKAVKPMSKEMPDDVIETGSDRVGQPGKYHVYRAGGFSRSIAFTDMSPSVGETYSFTGFGDNDSVVRGYVVDIKNPFVSTDINDALAKLGSDKKIGHLGFVKADNLIAKTLLERGYDAWIKTEPEPPAKTEVNLIKGSDAYKQAKSGAALTDEWSYRDRLLELPRNYLQPSAWSPKSDYGKWKQETIAGIFEESEVFGEFENLTLSSFTSRIREAVLRDLESEDNDEPFTWYSNLTPAYKWLRQNEPERLQKYLNYLEALEVYNKQYEGKDV